MFFTKSVIIKGLMSHFLHSLKNSTFGLFEKQEFDIGVK